VPPSPTEGSVCSYLFSKNWTEPVPRKSNNNIIQSTLITSLDKVAHLTEDVSIMLRR